VREIFYRMGFNDQEIVVRILPCSYCETLSQLIFLPGLLQALIGAHAVGRCHTDRSGYEGA
jgi:hypothetical protein